jgi:cyclopropane fatty-acyl-phospholipid synthase-like methyltransferase
VSRGNGLHGNPSPRLVFVPTPQDVVGKMLELAKVKTTDVFYDLGSGDGRIVITAAKKYGSRAVGYEVDKESRTKAEAAYLGTRRPSGL